VLVMLAASKDLKQIGPQQNYQRVWRPPATPAPSPVDQFDHLADPRTRPCWRA
jgi:hypothetical protein